MSLRGEASSSRYLRLGAMAAVGLGCAVLLAAYVVICFHTHSAWPWLYPVHEDGKRTLLDTVLYYEHATRELPIDLLFGVAVGGSAYYAFPARPERSGRSNTGLAIGLGIVVAIIVVGALVTIGPRAVVENLEQHHTRPGAPLVWGSHWRYHLLERLPMILVSVGLGLFARAALGPPGPRAGAKGLAVALGAVALYLVLTVVFTRSWADLRLPFFDPQYLGHEAREIMTHAIVTLPVAWGGCLLLQRRLLPSVAVAPLGGWGRGLLAAAPWLAVSAGAFIYVLFAALASDATSHGQSTDMVTLVFPHFFEHSFTYVVTPLTAALVYALCGSADRKR